MFGRMRVGVPDVDDCFPGRVLWVINLCGIPLDSGGAVSRGDAATLTRVWDRDFTPPRPRVTPC